MELELLGWKWIAGFRVKFRVKVKVRVKFKVRVRWGSGTWIGPLGPKLRRHFSWSWSSCQARVRVRVRLRRRFPPSSLYMKLYIE